MIDCEAMRAEILKTGMSQEEFAAKAHVHRNTLSSALNGKCTERVAMKVAVALGLLPKAFFADIGPEEVVSEDHREIIQTLHEMTPEGITAVVLSVRNFRHMPRFWKRYGRDRDRRSTGQ